MNNEQIKAAKSLQTALNKCAKSGLSGGVYDGTFCIWPTGEDPEAGANSKKYIDFFDAVDHLGMQLSTNMYLDGGAGN